MALEYPDYHQIVSTPMDLGSIQVRTHTASYIALPTADTISI